MKRKRIAKAKRRRAAVALETALMMPIFLLILIGILEFGRAVMIMQITTNAAREAARQSIIRGTTDEYVTKIITDYLSSASISSTDQVIEIRNGMGQEVELSTIPSHDEVTIFVSVPFEENSFGMAQWFVGKTLDVEVSMRRE